LAQSLQDEFDRFGELAVELRPDSFERSQLDVENFAGVGKMAHRAKMLGSELDFKRPIAAKLGCYSELG
jgi:hypothetical protein